MIDFLKSLTLACAPIVLSHVLDVRKERVKNADAPSASFAAYVRRAS
jgi:hypothetical protein